MTRLRIRSEAGQAIIEMALIMPLLLLLILGMLEFGWLLNGQLTVTASAREAARTAVLYDSASCAADAAREAAERVSAGSGLSALNTSTQFIGTQAKIRVAAEFKPLIGLFVSDHTRLEASAEMRLENRR